MYVPHKLPKKVIYKGVASRQVLHFSLSAYDWSRRGVDAWDLGKMLSASSVLSFTGNGGI